VLAGFVVAVFADDGADDEAGAASGTGLFGVGDVTALAELLSGFAGWLARCALGF